MRLLNTLTHSLTHKFQRRLLGIAWRDKVRNEDIRKKNDSRKLEDIIKERRLRCMAGTRLENGQL